MIAAKILPPSLLATQVYLLLSDDLTSGITNVLVFIPVTLLGNDPDPIFHWYWTLRPVAEHLNLKVSVKLM